MPPGGRGSPSTVLQAEADPTVVSAGTIRKVTRVSCCGVLCVLYVQSLVVLVPCDGLNSSLSLRVVSCGRLSDMSLCAWLCTLWVACVNMLLFGEGKGVITPDSGANLINQH